MKIFVYVMTHLGDPNKGVWGCNKCMGKKRSWGYEAVIGVGSVHADTEIAGKVIWIGVGPHRRLKDSEYPKVTFDQYHHFGVNGPEIGKKDALAKHIKKAPRGFMNLNSDERAEAEKLIELAKKEQLSPERAKANGTASKSHYPPSPKNTVRRGKLCPPKQANVC